MGKEGSKIHRLEDLEEGKFYGIDVLRAILKYLNLNHSVYIIRDYETWKCLNYHCGKRHNYPVSVCEGTIVEKKKDPVTGEIKIERYPCKGAVRPPLIKSPRTRGGGKGPGHRRYTAQELREVIGVFKERK